MRTFEHHPWCNYFYQSPEGCKQCASLFSKYPIGLGETPDDIQAKYFPDAIKIK